MGDYNVPCPFGGHASLPTGGFVGALMQPSVTKRKYLSSAALYLRPKTVAFKLPCCFGELAMHNHVGVSDLDLRSGFANVWQSASVVTAVPVSAMKTLNRNTSHITKWYRSSC